MKYYVRVLNYDTTYTARLRVEGAPWRDIDGTVTTTGPTADLRIAEATPLLSGDHRSRVSWSR